MTSQFTLDKNTNVAFIDVSEAAPNARIEVISVSDLLGLRSQVRARIDAENEVVLGLIIEDYPAFRRELRVKYVAIRVNRIIDLIVCSVRGSVAMARTATGFARLPIPGMSDAFIQYPNDLTEQQCALLDGAIALLRIFVKGRTVGKETQP